MTPKYKVIIQDEVIDELNEIYSFIAQDHPQNAKKFISELKEKIRSLKTMPERGSLCPEWQPDSETITRFITYKGYSIVYAIIELKVYIAHILSPGLNWR